MTQTLIPRLTLAAALTLVPTALGPPPDGGALRATLALVAELPDPQARALLILRAGSGDGVIVLRAGEATVTDLAAALALLDRTRQNEPVPLARDRQLVLKVASVARPLTDGTRRRLAAQLARLRGAPPRDVAGVGVVPAIDVQLGRRPRRS